MSNQECITCLSHQSTQSYCAKAFDTARVEQVSFRTLLSQLGEVSSEATNENVLDSLRVRLGQIGCELTEEQVINRI